MDFITGLPLSQGNTTILVVVDRFSKAARFIPQPKLPTAKETAELVINHVFRVFGIPQDIVSDRGPQFSSRFWRAFCQSLGATVSLSSGFHPESNGQTERLNQDLETTLRCMAVVTQCQPEDTHGEFQPSNRNELLPKSPPFHAKGRRSTDPITNARCKGTDGSGNGSGRLHGYIPRGYFNPSLSPSTKQYSVPFRTDKGKPFS